MSLFDRLTTRSTEARTEAEREAVTMGLYLTIVILAEAGALDAGGVSALDTVAAMLGSAIGLTVAHIFAFDVSGRIFARGRPQRSMRTSTVAQLVAAGFVAIVATVPFAVFSRDTAFLVSGLLMAALIGVTGYAAARAGGHGFGWAMAMGALTLVIAAAVVAVKAGLAH